MDGLDPAVGLIQQRAQLHGGRVPGLEDLKQIAQGVAAVQDVLHHDDVPTLNTLGQVLGNLHLTGGGGARPIGGHGHKVHRTGQRDGAHQIRHKNKGAPQDADEHGFLARKIPVNLTGDLPHPGLELFLAEQNMVDVLFQHGCFSLSV